MDLFTIIEDGVAIIRAPKGVFKQAKVYQRGGRVFVGHSGGFIRVCAKFGDTFGTSHPDIKVIDLEVPGMVLKGNSEPRMAASLAAVA